MKHKYNTQPLTFNDRDYLFEKLIELDILKHRLIRCQIENESEDIYDTLVKEDEISPMLILVEDEIHKIKLERILDDVHKNTMKNMIKELTDNFEHYDDEDYSFLNDYLQEERFIRTKSESV